MLASILCETSGSDPPGKPSDISLLQAIHHRFHGLACYKKGVSLTSAAPVPGSHCGRRDARRTAMAPPTENPKTWLDCRAWIGSLRPSITSRRSKKQTLPFSLRLGSCSVYYSGSARSTCARTRRKTMPKSWGRLFFAAPRGNSRPQAADPRACAVKPQARLRLHFDLFYVWLPYFQFRVGHLLTTWL